MIFGQLGNGTTPDSQLPAAGERVGRRFAWRAVSRTARLKSTERFGAGVEVTMESWVTARRVTDRSPIAVAGLSDIVALAAGFSHSSIEIRHRPGPGRQRFWPAR